MRHYLETVTIQTDGGFAVLKAQLSALEVTEAGEWRILLQGLKAESLVVLEELLGVPQAVQVLAQTEDGGPLRGTVRVARLSLGNLTMAVLDGVSPLP